MSNLEKPRNPFDTLILSPKEQEMLRNLPAAKELQAKLKKEPRTAEDPAQKELRLNSERLTGLLTELRGQAQFLNNEIRREERPMGERLMSFDRKQGNAQEVGRRKQTGEARVNLEVMTFREEMLAKGQEAVRQGRPLPSGFTEVLASILKNKAETLQAAHKKAQGDPNNQNLKRAQEALENVSELLRWAEDK